MIENAALWLPRPGAPFEVGRAPYTLPQAGEVVVRTRAIGLNFVDAIPGMAYRLILPWLTFPAIVGGDVAGEIVEIGEGVKQFELGDRVLGHALGLERSVNNSAAGAFQHYVVLMAHMVSRIPDVLTFEQASVLPLQMSTAATGLFERKGLALRLPTPASKEVKETVLIWGGSTGVGSNAIQLACSAGYRVIATASPRNFDYVRRLGASAAIDRTRHDAVSEIIDAIGKESLAGSIAIGNGSLLKVMRVAARVTGTQRVVSASPKTLTKIVSIFGPRRVSVSAIWGGALKDSEVGRSVYNDFLPDALLCGAYVPAPPAEVVGIGLAAIPAGLELLRKGVSAKKLVVTI